MLERGRKGEPGTGEAENECQKEEENEKLAQEKLKTSARKRKKMRIQHRRS